MTAARYRLLSRIGSGILADSFRAECDDGRPVVVKLFHAGTADDRYAREIAEVARRLLPFQVPGIAQVTEIGYAAGRLAVVRECNDDFNLGQVLSRLTTWGIIFPTPLALWVVCELLDAVRRAHAAGVIHGGIAPGNILFGAHGQPSLCDFGALQALCAVPELKARFAPAGRGSYRSQEVERGEAPTQRSDVFSLGAVAYQLLTLREVSPERSDVKSPRPAPAAGSQLDQRLYPVLMKALETIPQLRYPSCAEFAEALQAYLAANRISPTRQQLHKLLLDLFPEGAGLASGEDRLPFKELFVLDPIRGIAPLERPAREPWSASAAAASSPASESGGFGAAWCAPPTGESDGAPAAASHSGAADTSVSPPSVFAPPAPAQPRHVPEGPVDAPVRKRLSQQKALGLAGSLLIAGSFAIALSVWRPGHGKTQPRPADLAPAAPASAPAARAASPVAPLNEPPLAPAASVQPAGPKAARSEERVEWDSPPQRGGGYLFVSSDLPALVYVDGRRVREPAPLRRYPVQVGMRKITVVAADTQERRDFIVHFGRGQVRKIDSSFESSSARR